MATLGELERSVMELLWDSTGPLTAAELRDGLAAADSSKELAATTVLTVLSRLEAKGFVTRERDIRPHQFEAATSRENHMAQLMHDVLGTARDREAVLARFVGQVDSAEAETLRRMLDRT